MSDDNGVNETTLRLRHLIETADLSRTDGFLAERCLRRLEHPLRVTVFGTDPSHAVSLVNLMLGKAIVPPTITRARIQFLHSEIDYARMQFRDGSQQRTEGSDFARLFDDAPSKVRICTDLPVLKKLSILIAAEANPKSLCSDVEKTLPAADITLWAGAALHPPMDEVWQSVPDRLRDHSYLVLSPEMESETWTELADEFAGVIRVDPIRAQDAKSGSGGVDKAAFKDSGGLDVVKTIKHEIDVLIQSAMDASEVLLLRYADQLDANEDAPSGEPVEAAESVQDGSAALPEEESAQVVSIKAQPRAVMPEPAPSEPKRHPVISVPLGKLASRSRLMNQADPDGGPKITQRTVSLALKNMPKNTSRPTSRVRTRSRPSRATATPWSLGLD